jgi:hypothetical protein
MTFLLFGILSISPGEPGQCWGWTIEENFISGGGGGGVWREFLQCAQTGSGTHPASYSVGMGE